MKHNRLFFFKPLAGSLIAVALFMAVGSPDLFAQRGGAAGSGIEIRLASPLPENSAWGEALKRLAADWARATDNQVRVRILHNAVEGGEERMISSLASNNIQAALFSSFGLSAICPPVMTMSVPFNIRNDAELNAVYNEVEPMLDDIIRRNNQYYVLAWSKAGWVNVYSTEPVKTPDQLKRLKISSNSEAEHMNNAFKTMGFNIV